MEILCLWLVALPIFGMLLYVRHRLSVSRRTAEPFRLTDPNSRLGQWATAVFRTIQARLRPHFSTTDKANPPPPEPPSVNAEALRWPVGILLGSGVLLFMLGQAAYRQVPWPGRGSVLALMAVGAGLFLLSGFLARGRFVTQRWAQPFPAIAQFCQITPLQVLLLVLALLFAWLASLTAGVGSVAYHVTAAVTAWWGGIILAVLGGLRSGERFWFRPDRRDVLLVVALFLGALLLRGLWLEQFPHTLSGDEGSAGLMARDFRNGVANNPFTFGWFSFPSLYFAVQSSGIWLLGSTTAALRLTSALAGALTVVAVYGLARVMFDRTTAVAAAAYLAVAHYHIHLSRIGLNNIWDGLFAAAAIGWLWHGWQYNRRSSFLLAGLAVGLAQYFYVSVRLLPLLFLAWGGLAWLVDKTQFRQRLPDLLLSVYVALVTFLPLGILFARSPDNFNAPLQRVSIFNGWLEQEMMIRGETAVGIILDQMTRSALGFTHEPLRLLYDPGVPLLLPGAATLFLLGLLWALLHLDLRYMLLLLPLLATVITGSLSLDPPASQRYVMAMPLVAVLVAVPVGQAGGWLRHLWPGKWVTAVAVTAMLLALAVIDVHYYFFDVYDHYVLGGWNTETATEIAHYLRDHPVQGQDVYFLGAPRMGYYSLSTIPYLAPNMHGIDVVDPLSGNPSWVLRGPTLFVFLPEREGELAFVQSAYPNGQIYSHHQPDGQRVFTVYAIP